MGDTVQIQPIAESIKAFVSRRLQGTGIDSQAITDRIIGLVVEQALSDLFGNRGSRKPE